jgi:hypothetical protein
MVIFRPLGEHSLRVHQSVLVARFNLVYSLLPATSESDRVVARKHSEAVQDYSLQIDSDLHMIWALFFTRRRMATGSKYSKVLVFSFLAWDDLCTTYGEVGEDVVLSI